MSKYGRLYLTSSQKVMRIFLISARHCVWLTVFVGWLFGLVTSSSNSLKFHYQIYVKKSGDYFIGEGIVKMQLRSLGCMA